MSSLKEGRKRIQFVYKTTNLLNGTYYIGVHSTWNIDDSYLGSGNRLTRAVKKYGKENFKREILEFFETNKEAYLYEAHIVSQELLNDPLCLNLRPGGLGGFYNEAHQKKLSIAGNASPKKDRSGVAMRLWKDEEYREKVSKSLAGKQSFLGKVHSDESKQKIRESMKNKGSGNLNSQFDTCWITNGSQNKKIRKGDSVPIGWSFGRIVKKN
jgi:hypothetical protein